MHTNFRLENIEKLGKLKETGVDCVEETELKSRDWSHLA
jgi:hypothetical protein